MKQFITGILLLLGSLANAQNRELIAMEEFKTAEQLFEKKNYTAALKSLDETVKILGKENPRTLYLRMLSTKELIKVDTSYAALCIRACNDYQALSKKIPIGEDKLQETADLKNAAMSEWMAQRKNLAYENREKALLDKMLKYEYEPEKVTRGITFAKLRNSSAHIKANYKEHPELALNSSYDEFSYVRNGNNNNPGVRIVRTSRDEVVTGYINRISAIKSGQKAEAEAFFNKVLQEFKNYFGDENVEEVSFKNGGGIVYLRAYKVKSGISPLRIYLSLELNSYYSFSGKWYMIEIDVSM